MPIHWRICHSKRIFDSLVSAQSPPLVFLLPHSYNIHLPVRALRRLCAACILNSQVATSLQAFLLSLNARLRCSLHLGLRRLSRNVMSAVRMVRGFTCPLCSLHTLPFVEHSLGQGLGNGGWWMTLRAYIACGYGPLNPFFSIHSSVNSVLLVLIQS